MKKRILFITDSLALPRTLPEKIMYEETYLYILKEKYPTIDFLHVGVGGGTIKKLFDYSQYFHETLNPSLVFIQSGIVDCSPRALKEFELDLLNRIPIIGKLILHLVKINSNSLRSIRNIQYTSISDYISYIKLFESIFKKIVWIEILPPVKEYNDKVRNIGTKINIYNNEIRKQTHISCIDFKKEFVQSDFHHLSVLGHIELANKISEKIDLEYLK